MDSQPRSCARVGSPSASVNHCWTIGWNLEKDIGRQLPAPSIQLSVGFRPGPASEAYFLLNF
jgi:hypothetical protein